MKSLNGLVRIDKPAGCTSHDVVNRWRRISSIKRVGHLGTLDPMATGLLLLLSGTATRLAPFYVHSEKTYLANIRFGVLSDTYDAEGEVRETGLPVPNDRAAVDRALDRFRGKFLQTPPSVSAKKVRGTPAYKLVRKEIEFELKPVEVHVLLWSYGILRTGWQRSSSGAQPVPTYAALRMTWVKLSAAERY